MYNGIIYTYVYNLQGDIVSLIDGDNSVVEYNYDVWGRLLSITGTLKSTLGKDNPFRYRGYMYDEDIKLYYLKSRDYSSFTSRFINLDSLVDLRKGFMRNNMFAYGRNNPITFIDPTGHSFQDLIAAIAAGIVTATNVFIKATELFTGGKKYPLYQPPSNKGPILSPIYKTIATGKSTVKFFFHELVLNTPFQLEEGCTFASGLNILRQFKNGIAWAEMNVYIESSGDNTRARVTVQFFRNITIDHFGTGIKEESVAQSQVLTLIELTPEEGIFWDGKERISISNEKGWLTDLIAGVEINAVGE